MLKYQKCWIQLPNLCLKDPVGIFDLVEVIGNGTYGQVYKVSFQALW